MDEVHELIYICRGYCLHRNTISFDSGEDNVLYWKKEQTDKAPASGKNYCTYLFYQLRWHFLILLLVLLCALLSFVHGTYLKLPIPHLHVA